jgi:two-component system CheB/CheR fusion protein
MTHLVNDLVDASRVRNGKITLKKRTLLLSEIIESAVETSQPLIHKRHQELIVDLPVDPITINGDLVRLAQVFSNLLINAAKFTPEQGHITVSAHMLEHTVTMLVIDDGVGIAPDMQPFIFDLFTQGPQSLARSEGGLGVGLSLVRTLVEMHGGTVKVESGGLGCGSAFFVQLPISVESPFPENNPKAEAI